MDFPPFPGFQPAGLQFLRDLAQNNDREWFKPRKATFETECKWPLQCLVAECAQDAQQRNLPLTADPKKALFRIYRDTRFSKNKAPYKTHVSAVLSRSGNRKASGGLYIHIEPKNHFVACGFWALDSPILRAWRERMADDADTFLKLVNHLNSRDLSMTARESLKRLPRGFESHADSSLATYLRYKSFLVVRSIPEATVRRPAFTETVLETAEAALPLLTYGWEIFDTLDEA